MDLIAHRIFGQNVRAVPPLDEPPSRTACGMAGQLDEGLRALDEALEWVQLLAASRPSLGSCERR